MLQRGLQRELDQRNAGRAARVGLRLFLEQMRRVVGGEDVQARVGERTHQRVAIGRGLDRGIALDLAAERFVVRVGVAQKVHAGLRGDAFAHDRTGFEQRQLIGGGNVQHVQARAVAARGFHGPLRRIEAGLARADVRMHAHRDRVAVLRLGAVDVRVHDAVVLAMHGHEHRRVAEHAIERRRIAHAQIPRRFAQKHLHAGNRARIERTDRIQIVVAGTEIERAIDRRAACRQRVFVFQQCMRERWRIRVRHVDEAGHAAGGRRARFRGDVGFRGVAGLAEMHVVVDHAGNQHAAVCVENALARFGRQLRRDRLDATAAHAQIGMQTPAFVDDIGVGDQPVTHACGFPSGNGAW